MRGLLWTVLVAAACGGETAVSVVDGAVNTMEVDAARVPPDALPRGTVEVTVFEEFEGVPLEGATVVFLEPDGSLANRVLTDALGRASAELTSGGSVTAISFDVSTRLVTIVGVEAGDHLVIGHAPEPDPTETATLQVSFTPTAHRQHVLRTTCGTSPNATGSVISMPMRVSCDRTPRDLVLQASGTPGVAPQYAILRAESATTLAVPPTAWQAGSDGRATVRRVPSEVMQLNVGRLVRSGGRRVYASFSPVMPTAGDDLTVAIPNALEVGEDMIVTTELFAGTVPGTPKQTIRERRDRAETFVVDASAHLLPWVSGLDLDLGTRTLTWTQEGPGAGDVDAVITEIAYGRTVDNAPQYYRWRVIAPTATGSVVYPDLPPALDNVEPLATDDINEHPAVFLVRTDDETYRELRAHLDRDDIILTADGADIDLDTSLTVSKLVCGSGCSLPFP
jgi:hypothetical protein